MQLLNERFNQLTTSVLQRQTSGSGDTTKLLLKLQNGMQIEAVIMHYDTSGTHCVDMMLPITNGTQLSTKHYMWAP